MLRKIFIFLAIGLMGFSLSLTFAGCKKNKIKDTAAVEESEDDDPSEDESEESE